MAMFAASSARCHYTSRYAVYKPRTYGTKIEISVSCRNLRDRDYFSRSDPRAVLYIAEQGGPAAEVGRTEIARNVLEVDFAKKFEVYYHFEEIQKIRVDIYDQDNERVSLTGLRVSMTEHDFIGRVSCTLGEILGAPGGKIHRNLSSRRGKSGGSVIIRAEEVGNQGLAKMQWKGIKLDKKDLIGSSDPFLELFRVDADGTKQLVHRTETIVETLNPVWKSFQVYVRSLFGRDSEGILRLECHDWDQDGRHDLIGTCETTFQKLRKGANTPENVYELINPRKKAKKKDYKNSGQLHLTQFVLHDVYSFLDYIRGGTQLHFTVAVDFTASNGDPSDPASLHYIHPDFPNHYMMALKSVGEIIQEYDHDKLFPALGFGAKVPPNGIVSHEFFLNFTNDPHCSGVDGILDAYRNALKNVQLYGPTYFSPVINHVARFADNARGGRDYFVLLIVSNGSISDMSATVTSIIDASALPMSIIIVGVGNADFSSMRVLDSDKKRLTQGKREAHRDIVQFVAMRDYTFKTNSEQCQAKLAKEVLAEIPRQLTSYMKMMGIRPMPQTNPDLPQPSSSSALDTFPTAMSDALTTVDSKQPQFYPGANFPWQNRAYSPCPDFKSDHPPSAPGSLYHSAPPSPYMGYGYSTTFNHPQQYPGHTGHQFHQPPYGMAPSAPPMISSPPPPYEPYEPK